MKKDIPNTTVNAPKLVAKGISKKFGNVEALHDVDITIFPNKISAFVGPNGAGKTTLFHIISGSLSPSSGTVYLNDTNITGFPAWKTAQYKMGKLFQDVRVFPHMTVLENVMVALLDNADQFVFSAFRLGHNKKMEKLRLDEAMYYLEFVGLADAIDKKGSELSFGQQKLLAIARLMAHKSSLLLLDEPTAALSPEMTKKMIGLIQRLIAESNVSIALIEHNMQVVKELAFYTYFMHDGTIHCHGTQSCVLENPEVRELYMGLTSLDDGEKA